MLEKMSAIFIWA